MKFIFIIQGEGMGHTTQAIRLYDIIKSKGHDIISVYYGTNPQRDIPSQAIKHFEPAIHFFRSPNFIRSKNRKGILISRSFIYNILRIPSYIKSILFLRIRIRDERPDVIINFYDLIGGLSWFFSSSKADFYAISHHFLFEHPGFPDLKGFRAQKKLLVLHNRICALGAKKRIALSFRNLKDFNTTMVLPPLVRKDILESTSQKGEKVVIYLLNEGLSADLLPLFQKFTNINFQLFMREGLNPNIFPDNVEISDPGYEEFKTALVGCSGVITTSGFETICEAAFLGKPVFLIPSENHFEQFGNMEDARKAGIALSYLSFQPEHLKPVERENFRNWCMEAEKIFTDTFSL
ncbi:MAG: glycosyltransferase family protein [Bacteroidales bacterium]